MSATHPPDSPAWQLHEELWLLSCLSTDFSRHLERIRPPDRAVQLAMIKVAGLRRKLEDAQRELDSATVGEPGGSS